MPDCGRKTDRNAQELSDLHRRSDYQFRSCAWAFSTLGKTERAMDFLRLDAGSEWAATNTPSLLLRQGKVAEARESVKKMPAGVWRELLEACLDPRRPVLDGVAHRAETALLADPDPREQVRHGNRHGHVWSERERP